jgi:hypothetical protein
VDDITNELIKLLTHKLNWLVILAIGGLLFVLFRWIHFQINRRMHENIIQTIQKNAAMAKVYSDTLDLPYGSVKYDSGHFHQVMTRIRNTQSIGPYQIAYIHPLNQDEILIFTTLSFVDFDIGITGSPEDTAKKAHHNFLVTNEPELSQAKVFSTLYTNTTEKFQKEAFTTALAIFFVPSPIS